MPMLKLSADEEIGAQLWRHLGCSDVLIVRRHGATCGNVRLNARSVEVTRTSR